MQGAELLALADNVKILNNDDALDRFKKTLPGSSAGLLQVQITAKATDTSSLGPEDPLYHQLKAPALAHLASRIASAMKLSHGDDIFAKIKGMVSNMIEKLEQEAAEAAEPNFIRQVMS